MGGGYAESEVVVHRGESVQFPAKELHNHPNLEFPEPPTLSERLKRTDVDDIVEYVLECVATLISPPRIAGENASFDCKDVATEIRLLKSPLKKEIWNAEQEYGERKRQRINNVIRTRYHKGKR